MSVTYTENTLYLKDKSTGQLLPVGVFGSGANESLEEIKNYADTKVSEAKEAIETKKQEAIDAAPDIPGMKEEIVEISKSILNKLDKPEDTPEVGKILKVKSVNDDGSFVCEWANAPSGIGGVSDVQVNGETVVDEEGVANIEGNFAVTKEMTDSLFDLLDSCVYSSIVTDKRDKFIKSWGVGELPDEPEIVLPEGYTKYDWIANTNIADSVIRINTNTPTAFGVEVEFATPTATSIPIFGVRCNSSGTENKPFALFGSSTGKLGFWLYGNDTQTSIMNLKPVGEINKVIVKPITDTQTTIICNGVEYFITHNARYDVYSDMAVMGYLRNPTTLTAQTTAGTKVGNIRFFNSEEETIANFVPCRNADYVIGYYDTVNGVFATSKTPTNLIGGKYE